MGKDQSLVLRVDYKLDNTSGKHMLGRTMLGSPKSDLKVGKEVRKEQNRRSSRRVKVW